MTTRAADWRAESHSVDAARYESAGGLYTTPTENAKFLIEIMDPKPSDVYRLSARSLKEMVRPPAKATESMSWGSVGNRTHEGWRYYRALRRQARI
jgi:CubicO group peptidase (beta-lactamase class C family)